MDNNPQDLKIDQERTSMIADQISNIKRPETKIWWYDRLIHKMEPNRITFFDDAESTISIKIWRWDYLQFNNQQISDNNIKKEKIDNLELWDKSVERDEIEFKKHFDLDKSYKFSFDFFVPEDFPIIDNRLVLGQWKQQFEEWTYNNPIIAQRFRNGKYTISFNSTWNPKWWVNNKICELDAKEILGKRTKAEYEIRFSEHDDWYVKIRHNLKLLWEYTGRVSSSSTEYPIWKYYKDNFFFKFWLYRDTYQKRLLELKNEEVTDENKQKIKTLEKVIEDENNGKLMTIFFKNYLKEL